MSAEQVVRAATSDRRDRAEAALAARPELAGDPWVRLVLGRGWDGDPNAPGGPLAWGPLHYVCHSAFASVELARELLERGADPNAFYANEHGPMSALFGAAGRLHDPALTALLLEHGADPNGEPWFGDALYHAVEAPDTACLRLLLEHGARPSGSNAVAHALDYEPIEPVRLLLEAGDVANEGALLVHAVRRGRGPEHVELLAAHGAELDRRGGEWSTPEDQYRTAYQNAVLRDRTDVMAVLERLGASTAVSPGDLAVAAVARGERPPGGLPDPLDADAQEVLVTSALAGRIELVVSLVGPRFFGHAGGGPPGTLLHHAAWVGDAAIVERLLELGADPVASSGAEFDTPVAWAVLGAQYAAPGRDHVAVVERLLAAGARLEERFPDVAQGPLAAWFAARDDESPFESA